MTETTINQKPDYSLPEKARVYRRRFRRAIEQVFIDEQGQAANIGESFSTLLATDKSKYKRTVAALRIINQLTPQVPVKILRKRYAYKQDSMPFSPKDYTLKDKIGSGGMNDVFLLQSNRKDISSYVLKINLGERGGSGVENLLSVAKEQKKEYEKISAVYKDIPGIVPKEYHLVMHGPSMETPVATTIQPFIGENIRDFFVDFEKDELLDLLRKNKLLANQIIKFTEITRADEFPIENELDLLGMNNLAIVGEKENERLLLLDPHFRSSVSRSAEAKRQIRKRINYIEELAKTSS